MWKDRYEICNAQIMCTIPRGSLSHFFQYAQLKKPAEGLIFCGVKSKLHMYSERPK